MVAPKERMSTSSPPFEEMVNISTGSSSGDLKSKVFVVAIPPSSRESTAFLKKWLPLP